MSKFSTICRIVFAALFAGCDFTERDSTQVNNTKLLHETGNIALFSCETAADVESNAQKALTAEEGDFYYRNSLCLRRHKEGGGDEWRLLVTTDGDWKAAEDMDDWGRYHANELRARFEVYQATLSADGNEVWMVCNSGSGFFSVVCRYNIRENSLKVVSDGSGVELLSDGKVLIKEVKSYHYDENGESLGARWQDVKVDPSDNAQGR